MSGVSELVGLHTDNDNQIEIAEILNAMSALLEDLYDADLKLQEALSTLALRAKSVPEVSSLQHIDLLTQTHRDLASLLSAMSNFLAGDPIEPEALKSRLTLRSLQDALFDGASDEDDENVAAGEMSLF